MNLVVIVLILSCLVSVCKAENEILTGGTKSDRSASIKLPVKNSSKISRIRINASKHGVKQHLKPGHGSKKNSEALLVSQAVTKLSKSAELRERPGKHKKSMNRVMMALLMAYKLKFAALIPTMIGGLILLMSTTALAGFFFALFAAILGLKGQ